MKDKERIPVFAKIEKGRTVCLCKRDNKRCGSKTCEPDFVERDRFEGWENGLHRNKFGRY